MSGHTPGPWELESNAWDNQLIFGSDGRVPSGRRFIAEVSLDYDGAEANARLIASAPCLFYTLSQIISDLPTNRDWLDPELERMAKEAIAKATAQNKPVNPAEG